MDKSNVYEWIRVLRYVGEREWLDEAVLRRGVKGSYLTVRGVIQESTLSEVPRPVPTGALRELVRAQLTAGAEKFPDQEMRAVYLAQVREILEEMPL